MNIKRFYLFILIGVVLPGWADTPLPDFGNPADSVLTRSQEAQLGRQVVRQLRNAGAMIEDPQLHEYIQTLGATLAAHAHDGEYKFEFFVVNDDAINAFALPGGYIGVNVGLIQASETESELAGVLAHEIAHVTQRHIARSVYDNQRSSILSIAAMLAAVLLGAASDAGGDAMQGILTASQAAVVQRQIDFTRSNEFEADRIGMDTLYSAGFDPVGMASFFEKLSRRYGLARQKVPQFLQTHPVTSERIAGSRNRVRQLPNVDAHNTLGYELTKAKLTALGASSAEEGYTLFQARLEKNDVSTNRYGMALSLARWGRNDHAEEIFKALSEEEPGVIAYRIGLGESLMASGSVDVALTGYADAINLFPRNVPLTISYARALISAGKPSRAHKLLLDLLNNVPPTPEQIRLIARAANAEGDIGNAQHYMSEYYIMTGNLPLAINQLRMAIESPGVNPVDLARYQSRLDELIEAMSEDK